MATAPTETGKDHGLSATSQARTSFGIHEDGISEGKFLNLILLPASLSAIYLLAGIALQISKSGGDELEEEYGSEASSMWKAYMWMISKLIKCTQSKANKIEKIGKCS